MGSSPLTEKQVVAFTKATAAMRPAMEKLRAAFIAWGKAYKEYIEPQLWAAYERAQMPYGGTEEGMWRWLREQQEIADADEANHVDLLFGESIR